MSQSSCLYDEGEEGWPVKLHLGCGGVYLRGYVNCDIDGLDARTNPVTVTANSADVSDYYAGLDGDMHHLPMRRLTVVDLQSDIVYLPYKGNTVDKILAVQVFEHLSPINAAMALRNWRWILKDGRPLVMSVPDMGGVMTMLENMTSTWEDRGIADFGFILRHLRGRNGDGYNTHRAWYTEAMATEADGGHYKVYANEGKPLLITEFSNPWKRAPKADKGRQYKAYYASLPSYVIGAYSFISSASNPAFSSETWAGSDIPMIVGS